MHSIVKPLIAAGLLGLAFLVPFPGSSGFAHADEPAEDPEGLDLSDDERRERAREAFARGRAAYVEGRHQEAIGHWETANDVLPNPRLWLYIGQAYANLDNYREAIRHYRLFERSSSEAAAEIADDLAALLAQARLRAVFEATVAVDTGIARSRGNQPVPRSMRRYELGTTMRDVPVQIRSVPSGAQVYVDDVDLGPVGTTPLDTRLFTGNHLIVVEREHYLTQRRVVPVNVPRSGESIPLIRFDLEKIQVPVRISVDPITANVTFIGEEGIRRDLGIGGWEGELPAGPGTFVVQQAGRDRRVTHVITPADEDERMELTLHLDEERASRSEISIGTLRVRAEALDGDVLVNGRRVGRSPGEYTSDLAPGSHRVEVRRDGYQTWSQSVEVVADREVTLVTPASMERLRTTPVWPGWVFLTLGAGGAGAGSYLYFAEEEDAGLYAMIGGGTLAAAGVIWVIAAGAARASAQRSADAEPGLRFQVAPTPDGGFLLLRGNLP